MGLPVSPLPPQRIGGVRLGPAQSQDPPDQDELKRQPEPEQQLFPPDSAASAKKLEHLDVGREDRQEQNNESQAGRPSEWRNEQSNPARKLCDAADDDEDSRARQVLRDNSLIVHREYEMQAARRHEEERQCDPSRRKGQLGCRFQANPDTTMVAAELLSTSNASIPPASRFCAGGSPGIVVALALPQFNIAPVLDDIVRFVQQPNSGCG